jgi:hypothetical protein
MADIITGTTTGFVNNIPDSTLNAVNDLRVQTAEDANEICNVVKDARYDINTRITDAASRGTDLQTQYFIAEQSATVQAARDLGILTAVQNVTAERISSEIQAGIAANGAATALASEKVASAVALGQALLGKDIMLSQAIMTAQITNESEKTRGLINDLKYQDLNRSLIERNTELVEERHERRHYRDRADQFQSQGQWAAVQSQLQAFQSQLQTATQGTVNFGTMSGNAGRNTSTNNVA